MHSESGQTCKHCSWHGARLFYDVSRYLSSVSRSSYFQKFPVTWAPQIQFSWHRVQYKALFIIIWYDWKVKNIGGNCVSNVMMKSCRYQMIQYPGNGGQICYGSLKSEGRVWSRTGFFKSGRTCSILNKMENPTGWMINLPYEQWLEHNSILKGQMALHFNLLAIHSAI